MPSSRPDRASVLARRRVWLAASGLAMAVGAFAQPAASARAWSIQPSASVSQTFTDNYALSGIDPAGDAITRLTAGVQVGANAGLVRGHLDYKLSWLAYARHNERNTYQNSLNTAFAADLVPGRMRVDVQGGISRSAISAFSAQPTQDGGAQTNSTELRRLNVTPSITGPLAGDLRYSGNLVLEASDARDTDLGDSSSATLGLHVEPVVRGVLRWSADGSMLRSDFKAGRATSNDRLYGTGRWRIDSLDTELTGSGGIEYSDMSSAARQRYTNWGLGATWAPSPRTTVAAQYDDRFFGPSRRLSLDYRTALTSWHVGKSRSLSTNGGQGEVGGQGTAFDLLYSQFASVLPDPAKRTDFVNAYLRSQGISPTAEPGFLRASVLVQDREEASMAYRAVRSTAVLTWSRTRSARLTGQAGLADDLATSSEVMLQGFSLNLAHRLTPESTVGMLLSRQNGSGSTGGQGNQQRQLNLHYALRPTANSNVTLALSRILATSFSAPYDETALVVTLGYRF